MKLGHIKLTLDVGHYIGTFDVTVWYRPDRIEQYEILKAVSKWGDCVSSEYINDRIDDDMRAEILEQIKEIETGLIQF